MFMTIPRDSASGPCWCMGCVNSPKHASPDSVTRRLCVKRAVHICRLGCLLARLLLNPQSDRDVCVYSVQKASTPDILKAFHQEDPKHPPDPVLKQDTPPSSPTHSAVFSGGLRHVSLLLILFL